LGIEREGKGKIRRDRKEKGRYGREGEGQGREMWEGISYRDCKLSAPR